jgi:hypothetical protein
MYERVNNQTMIAECKCQLNVGFLRRLDRISAILLERALRPRAEFKPTITVNTFTTLTIYDLHHYIKDPLYISR